MSMPSFALAVTSHALQLIRARLFTAAQQRAAANKTPDPQE
jgi:hypothetical protein